MAADIVLSLKTQIGVALDDSNKTLKLIVFRLAKQLEDASFAADFISAGGTEILLEILQKCSANLVNYTMKALLNLLCKLQGLEHVSNNQVAIERIFSLMYDDSPHAINLIGPASALLHILAEYSSDGTAFDVFDSAAKQTAISHQEKPYQRIIQFLDSKSLDVQTNCSKLLNIMLKKALAVGKLNAFLSYLHQLEILKTIEKAESKLDPSSESKQELEKLRLICDPGGQNTETDFSKKNFENEWRLKCFETVIERSMGIDLASRLTALENTSILNQVKLQEFSTLSTLNEHIKKLESRLVEQEEKKDSQLLKIIDQQNELHKQLEDDKKKLEERIKLLENDVKSKDQQNQQNLQKLKELSRTQEEILMDVNKARTVTSQQDYIKETKNLWIFYQTLQLKLNQVLLAYKMLSTGMIQAAETEKQYLEKGILLAGDLIPFPGAKACATVLSLTVGFVRKRREKKCADQRAELTVSVNALETLTEHCARALAFMYEEQILSLDKESVQKLAECCVKRMLASMSSGGLHFTSDMTDDQLCHLLIVSVTQPSFGLIKITEMKFKLHEEIRHKTDDRIWTERGVLSKTGIRTIDGKFFSGGECRPEKYGYKLGDEKLAKDLKFTQTSSRVFSSSLRGSSKTLQLLNNHSSSSLHSSLFPHYLNIAVTTLVVNTSTTTPTTRTIPTSTSTVPSTKSIVPSASSTMTSNVVSTPDVYTEMEALKKRVAYLESSLEQVLSVVIKLQTQLAEKNKS